MRIHIYSVYFSILLCAPLHGQTAERVYKWIDTQGQVHYASHPPVTASGAVKEVVNLKPNIIKSLPVPPTSRKKITSAPSGVNRRIPASAQLEKQQLRCQRARSKLQQVRARLRAGYKYSQYSRLHAREAEYRAQRQAHCR